MDNKPVHILSTMPCCLTTCIRRVKVTVNGVDIWQEQQFFQPTHVRLYNRTMGGTDAEDQRLSYYRPKVKTVSHAPRIFIHMIQASLVNAFIIYKHRNNLNPNQYRYLDFLNAVIDQWSHPWIQRIAEGDAQLQNAARRSRVAWNKDRSRLVGRHYPVMIVNPTPERRGVGNVPRLRNLDRGRCINCTDHANTKCIQCGVYLCCRRTPLQMHINDENCWMKFHTYRNFITMDEDSDED